MGDTKNSREDQAADEERRQREREIAEALERGDEPEPPPVERESFGDLDDQLADLNYPATASDVVRAVGDSEVETATTDGPVPVAELLPADDAEQYDAPETVHTRIERPTVGAALARIEAANRSATGDSRLDSRRGIYEKTLRALQSVTPDDEDEGIDVVTDWTVEQTEQKGTLPSSRSVRRRAAKYCRSNGYEVSANTWLGV